MKISFVIPAYNEERYIKTCIDSIINALVYDLYSPKSYKYESEIIVVNNASTDGTEDIVRQYPNVILVNEPRKGLTHARQAGYLASTGDIIANVDADCILPEKWINIVITNFIRNKNLVALSGPFIYYDLRWYQKISIRLFYALAQIIYFINKYILDVGSMVQGGNFVIRKTALDQINGFNLDISFYGEDTDIATRLHTVGDVKFYPKLKMLSSARRLKHEGILTMAVKYSINYFWMIFFKKAKTNDYIDIRHD